MSYHERDHTEADPFGHNREKVGGIVLVEALDIVRSSSRIAVRSSRHNWWKHLLRRPYRKIHIRVDMV